MEGVLAPATASGSGEITAGDTPLDEASADVSAKSRSKRITKAAIAATYLVTKTLSKPLERKESKEKTLWKAAERNVFEMEDNDKEDQGEVDEEEYCYEE